MKTNMARRFRTIGSLSFAVAAAAAVTSVPTTSTANPDKNGRCVKAQGAWSSEALAGPECESPVGICTDGDLGGTLNGGTYDFTMNTLEPVPDPNAPFVAFFTGSSKVTTRWGRELTGVDTGAMNLNPPIFFGSGKFSTLLTFTEGGTGYLWIHGTLNFVTGGAEGSYEGEICFD